MRIDMLYAHNDDLGERIGQIFGVNVYNDPDTKTRKREIIDRAFRIAMSKKSTEETQ